MVNGIVDVGGYPDGFKKLVLLCHPCGTNTVASLLHAFMEATRQNPLKAREISKGLYAWESKVDALKSRYTEELNGNIKLAILIGMLPKKYQGMCLQTSCVATETPYESMRDNVLIVTTSERK